MRYITAFFLMIFSLFAEQGYIEWKPIEGTSFYHVEIRNKDRKIITSERTESTRFEVQNPEGSYEFQITPHDLFEKPGISSGWKPLKIIVSRIPELKDNVIVLSPETKFIRLKGKNFLPATKAYVVKEKKHKELSKKYISSEEIDVNLKEPIASQGEFDLVLENPNHKILSRQKYFKIAKKDTEKKPPVKEPAVTVVIPEKTVKKEPEKKPPEKTAVKPDLPKKEIPKKEIPEKTVTVPVKEPEKPPVKITVKPVPEEELKPLSILVTDGIYGMTSHELNTMIQLEKKSCGDSELPHVLIERCFNQHLELNINDRRRKDLYHYIYADSSNYKARMRSYEYFTYNPRYFPALREKLNLRLKDNNIDSDEKIKVVQLLDRI